MFKYYSTLGIIIFVISIIVGVLIPYLSNINIINIYDNNVFNPLPSGWLLHIIGSVFPLIIIMFIKQNFLDRDYNFKLFFNLVLVFIISLLCIYCFITDHLISMTIFSYICTVLLVDILMFDRMIYSSTLDNNFQNYIKNYQMLDYNIISFAFVCFIITNTIVLFILFEKYDILSNIISHIIFTILINFYNVLWQIIVTTKKKLLLKSISIPTMGIIVGVSILTNGFLLEGLISTIIPTLCLSYQVIHSKYYLKEDPMIVMNEHIRNSLMREEDEYLDL